MNSQKYGQIAIEALQPYEKNARTHSPEQVEKIAKSIREFGFINPVLIDKKNMIIAGHGRVLAAKKLKMKEVPCLRVEDLTDTQIRAYILADNKLAEEAGWDELLLSQELAALKDDDFDIELTGFEMTKLDDWFDRSDREKDWDARQEGNDEYNEFLEKFEPKKTTDDCYTPPQVYDAVAEWVAKEYKLDKSLFLRPFYPGGNYQTEKYASGCTVVDNPPFSILSEIIGFYCEKKINFFLFAPHLTLFGSGRSCEVCYLPAYCDITYENGACVKTSFITNLDKARVKSVPELYKTTQAAADDFRKGLKRELPKYSYPNEVITSSAIGQFSKYGIEFCVYPDECERISKLDAQSEDDKAIFGSGFLISEKAAAEKAAAEKAAAEKAAAHRWPLSEREKAIVRGLGKGATHGK